MRVFIFTVTGDQGSSVAKYLLEDQSGKYEVIGITRNPDSEKAQSLAKLGVKLIKGDLSDPLTYQDQIKDIDAAYVNADFWTHYSSNGQDAEKAMNSEIQDSIGAIEVCVKAGVKHVVYSTLDQVGKGECPHFESKNYVSNYLKEHKIPHTNLITCNYFSNFTKFGFLKRASEVEDKTHPSGNGENEWILSIPLPDDTVLSSYPVEQTGLWVKEALNNPDKWIGKDIYATTSSLTIGEMAKTLSNLNPTNDAIKVKTLGTTYEEFHSQELKNQVGEELWLALKLLIDGKMTRAPEIITDLPGTWNFEQWARQNSTIKEWFKL